MPGAPRRRGVVHRQPSGGEHRIDNGLLPRSNLHRLYDRGYVKVTPDYVFRVGDSLRDDFKNGRSYYGLDRQKIAVPDREVWRPRNRFQNEATAA